MSPSSDTKEVLIVLTSDLRLLPKNSFQSTSQTTDTMWIVLLWTALLGLISQCATQSFQGDRWGPWSDWTPCTQSCGGGTTSRTRQCLPLSRSSSLPRYILKVYKQYGHNKGNCHGTDTQYDTCNMQKCYKPPVMTRQRAIEARAEQCSKFDNTSFNGYFFTWVPYLRVKDSDECELNCLAKGHKFFLRLSPKVKDGTPCLSDLKKVCIDGTCKDLPSECKDGGCFGQKPATPTQRRSGVFTSRDVSRGHLILGYNPVITIPAGATNINVTEIRRSKNYLALKSHDSNKYYINGNWVIDLPKGYDVADTTVYYTRPRRNKGENEAFIAAGPTSEDLDVMLLYQDDEPRIMYSYLIPKEYPITQNRKNNSSQQSLPAFCTHSCAGGVQKTVYQCVTSADNSVVEEAMCQWNLKPAQRQRVCNLQPCPPRWEPGQWGQCSKTCGAGMQIRSLLCKQLVDNNGARQQQMLPISYCRQWERPAPSRNCNLQQCPPPANWTVGEWSKCSVTCERGVKQRVISCVDTRNTSVNESFCKHRTKPPMTEPCFAGSCKADWVVSHKWSQCSVPCGRGQQSRQVFCGRKGGDALQSDKCSHVKKPSSTRPCNNGKCQAVWVASEWSKCSVECGTGTQFRTVFCAGEVGGMYQEFPDESCPRNSKPTTVQSCGNNSCAPQWFTTKWGKCSRSCGGGTQTRDVMCLDRNGQVSKECHSKNKPYHYQRCSNTPCPTSTAQVKGQQNCRDSYSGNVCMYVIQANFCQFSHYRRMCCNSCARRH
ncbi:hypothetical protein ACROYT_G001151 [Oculina patagonica]